MLKIPTGLTNMKWVFVRGLPLLVICLASTSIGCSTLSRQSLPQLGLPLPVAQLAGPPIPIGTLSEPDQNSRISVQGQVQQRAPLATGWLYLVEDDSGSIWVRSSEAAPPLGNWVRLEGQLQYRQILVDGTDQGEHYLEEQSRKLIEAETEATES
ncbi:MAG: hypothetical protein O2890_01505 [Cyanobacteria bacterium]|nr:hypothetical protein [Cyanobacteriota bacterium]MDA0865096.1 hypothetical protein [Cyanobacteriota bacterium]